MNLALNLGKNKTDIQKLSFLISFISSSFVALVLLIFDYIHGYEDYWHEFRKLSYSVNASTEIFGPIIILVATFSAICAFISLAGFIDREFLTDKVIKYGVFLSGFHFFMAGFGTIVGVTTAYKWWFGLAFYLGVIGNIVTFAVFVYQYRLLK